MENNSNKKMASSQKKITRRKQIEKRQTEWSKQAQKLSEEKKRLGYDHLSWNEFMALTLDDSSDTTKQSMVIGLQEEYKALLEEKEILWTEDTVIEELNKRHAVVRIDQAFILTEKINALGGYDFSLESRQSFRMYYEDERIMCIDGVERCKADIWLESPKRRKFEGIVFDPTSTGVINGHYNLWRGFTKKAVQGTCQKYWSHVKDNICNGNEELYQYVHKWLAKTFQQPNEVHTALVLCGSQGVGKNSFVNPLGELLGSHYAPLSSLNELTSNFNYHLKNAVLIHANEALWGGNKKEVGIVKAMITEPVCLIEGKGKDRIKLKNFKHLIFSSNEDWPVHLDSDDRRFVVVNVAETRKEDHEYFETIETELNDGGYEALLYDLLNDDISNFNPRKIPSSSGSFSIKMRSADSTYRYLYEVLSEGTFPIGDDSSHYPPIWLVPVQKSIVFRDYTIWCNENSEKALSKELFCQAIKKLIASIEEMRPSSGSRQRCYKFPSLKQSRIDFSKAFKENPARIFTDYEAGE